MDKIQKAILDAVDIVIKKRLKNFGFNYYVNGIIEQHNKDKNEEYMNSYNIKIQDTLYENIPAKYGNEYNKGDSVQVLIKNGKWENKYIDSYLDTNQHSKYLKKTGDKMQGKLDINNNVLTGLKDPVNPTDAVPLKAIKYAIEEGESNGWKYYKYADGTCELFYFEHQSQDQYVASKPLDDTNDTLWYTIIDTPLPSFVKTTMGIFGNLSFTEAYSWAEFWYSTIDSNTIIGSIRALLVTNWGQHTGYIRRYFHIYATWK